MTNKFGIFYYFSINASRSAGYPVQIRTEIILVSLPTPDFSMPYNVICLACTVVALAFGPLHNITTKRFDFESRPKLCLLINKIVDRLLLKDVDENKGFLEKLKEKFRKKTDSDAQKSDEKEKDD